MRTNRVIKMLMISDFFLLGGFGLIQPILAVFFKENLVGGSLLSAGIASTIFMVVKSIVMLPFSRYIDAHNNHIGMRWLIIGVFTVALVPFFYIFSTHIFHVYLAQIFYGIGTGIAFPAWLGLWSRFLDKNKESFEWSLYATLVGASTAIAATAGAAMAERFGFTYTFAVVGMFSLAGWVVLLWLMKYPPRGFHAAEERGEAEESYPIVAKSKHTLHP